MNEFKKSLQEIGIEKSAKESAKPKKQEDNFKKIAKNARIVIKTIEEKSREDDK